ncbi:MAG: Hpt domain-containing protein [Candidatus Aminicenantales bacterium]
MFEEKDSEGNKDIDLSEALERIGGDESFLQELLSIYAEDYLEKYPQLEKAISEQDFETIKEIGHSLKGSSGNLGLNRLQETCYAIELSGRERNLERAKQNVLLLAREFLRLLTYIPSPKREEIESKLPSSRPDV